MYSASTPCGSELAGLNHVTAGTRLITVPVSRDKWSNRQFQNNIDTSDLSPTERWVYDDQGTSGPYDAIGEVEISWANNPHGGCSGDYGGFATSTAATQGSAKVKTRSKKREKESSKQK